MYDYDVLVMFLLSVDYYVVFSSVDELVWKVCCDVVFVLNFVLHLHVHATVMAADDFRRCSLSAVYNESVIY